MDLYIALFSLCLGYVAGTYVEKKHFKSIRKRETLFVDLIADTFGKKFYTNEQVRAELVTGSVVISVDYFKRTLAALRNFLGGRVSSYESLLDRARREAILRMKEKAVGAEKIVNVRIETSSIGSSAGSRSGLGSIEALAYGTAIYPIQDNLSGSTPVNFEEQNMSS